MLRAVVVRLKGRRAQLLKVYSIRAPTGSQVRGARAARGCNPVAGSPVYCMGPCAPAGGRVVAVQEALTSGGRDMPPGPA